METIRDDGYILVRSPAGQLSPKYTGPYGLLVAMGDWAFLLNLTFKRVIIMTIPYLQKRKNICPSLFDVNCNHHCFDSDRNNQK